MEQGGKGVKELNLEFLNCISIIVNDTKREFETWIREVTDQTDYAENWASEWHQIFQECKQLSEKAAKNSKLCKELTRDCQNFSEQCRNISEQCQNLSVQWARLSNKCIQWAENWEEFAKECQEISSRITTMAHRAKNYAKEARLSANRCKDILNKWKDIVNKFDLSVKALLEKQRIELPQNLRHKSSHTKDTHSLSSPESENQLVSDEAVSSSLRSQRVSSKGVSTIREEESEEEKGSKQSNSQISKPTKIYKITRKKKGQAKTTVRKEDSNEESLSCEELEEEVEEQYWSNDDNWRSVQECDVEGEEKEDLQRKPNNSIWTKRRHSYFD
jgi:hypothetical protein